MNTINETNFKFPNQKSVYKGKVREVYNINDDLLVMIATDRLSAFDVILPSQIPYKGQILNQIATKMMNDTADIVPNWLLANPDENVAVGHLCEPFKVEMVIRGYVSGHAAREYKLGKRVLCGVEMPEGLKEDYTRKLFQRGTEIAAKRGLILVDTKYEFGKTKEGKIVLIDEIHTPDSSRYFYADGYQERQDKGEHQKQLSKEFVRQWLIENGFQGKENQQIPVMDDDKITEITGETFVKASSENVLERIEKNVLEFLASN